MKETLSLKNKYISVLLLSPPPPRPAARRGKLFMVTDCSFVIAVSWVCFVEIVNLQSKDKVIYKNDSPLTFATQKVSCTVDACL